MRIGNGYDVHPLVENRRLVIGGVAIEWHLGLQGHSDGDVLLHAVCDACLGAAGEGDLGRHFPSSDARYTDADSRIFVRRVRELLAAGNWQVVNLDCIVIAQRPKLNTHVPQMRTHLSADLGINANQINIKSTTTDSLGFCGREEGIAAHVVALIEQIAV